MKTPRQILLERHLSATAQLNAIRREVLATELGQGRVSAGEPRRLVILQQLWRELVWPCRRAWGALAAAWAVLLILQLALVSSPTPALGTAGQAEPSALERRVGLSQQKQLRAELGAGGYAQSESHHESPAGRPRSQLHAANPAA